MYSRLDSSAIGLTVQLGGLPYTTSPLILGELTYDDKLFKVDDSLIALTNFSGSSDAGVSASMILLCSRVLTMSVCMVPSEW